MLSMKLAYLHAVRQIGLATWRKSINALAAAIF